jgi:general secretion pathway protein D
MSFHRGLLAVLLSAVLIVQVVPLDARTRKGDKYLNQGQAFQAKKDWEAALDAYDKALKEDPSDIQYQMAVQKARFEAAQAMVEKGVKTRNQGMLGEALLQFQRAFATNPSSGAAAQEIATTQEMIQRERDRVLRTGKEGTPEERALTPAQEIRKETDDRIERLLPIPELKPLGPARLDFKINSNQPRALFETVARQAGINVIWDSDYNASPIRNQTVDFQNLTLDEALDYLALLTKSYWKPISSNAIFVTQDTAQKRRDFGSQVMRVFYLSNIGTQQELNDITNAVRTATQINNMFAFASQNAIVVKGDADAVGLAEAIIHDLDRPRAEVVIDIAVMETSSTYSRDLAASLASGGLNIPATFAPRSSITTTLPTTDSGSGTASTATSTAVPLANLSKVGTSDWAVTLPSALLQAVMSDARTKILQAPQIRSVDNVKASLKIGDRVPTATGSFQAAATTVSALVNTQFNYNDVGVNVDITPHVHDNGDVSMHIEMDVSSVNSYVDIGGISQPIIGQRKIVKDVRLRDGEVNLLGGLLKQQETKKVNGVPGLSSIPLLRRLFTSESIDREGGELMIAVTPHVIRRPEMPPSSLRAIDVGTITTLKLNYAPKEAPAQAAQPKPAAEPRVITPSPNTPNASTAPSPATPNQPPTAPTAPGPPGGPGGIPLPLQGLIRPPTAAASPDNKPPAAPATARFEPARVETSANGRFTVAVVAEGGADITSMQQAQIQFDPKMLNLVDVAPGDLFTRGGGQPAVARNIQNDQGIATIQLARGGEGVSGPGTLFALTFQATGKGSSNVSVLNITLRNSQNLAVGTSSLQLPVNIR